MKVSVIIPAYNEAGRIQKTLRTLKAHLEQGEYEYELIVVDDKSSDDTARLVRLEGVEPLCQPQNRGKGAAVKRGALAAQGDVVLFTDADLPYDLSLIEESVAHIQSGADLAIGSREGTGYETYGLVRRVSSAAFSFVTNLLLHLGINDTQCGFKAFSAQAAHTIFTLVTIDGFGFDAEALFIAKKHGMRIDRIAACMKAPPIGSSVHPLRDGVTMLRSLLSIVQNDRRGLYAPGKGKRK